MFLRCNQRGILLKKNSKLKKNNIEKKRNIHTTIYGNMVNESKNKGKIANSSVHCSYNIEFNTGRMYALAHTTTMTTTTNETTSAYCYAM